MDVFRSESDDRPGIADGLEIASTMSAFEGIVTGVKSHPAKYESVHSDSEDYSTRADNPACLTRLNGKGFPAADSADFSQRIDSALPRSAVVVTSRMIVPIMPRGSFWES
jgi:hypothetical protein